MEMIISFLEISGWCSFDNFTVSTDQPPIGVAKDLPHPFAVFLSQLELCRIYVLGFCKQRGLATDGIQIIERIQEIQLPVWWARLILRFSAFNVPGKILRVVSSFGEPLCRQETSRAPTTFNVYTKVNL